MEDDDLGNTGEKQLVKDRLDQPRMLRSSGVTTGEVVGGLRSGLATPTATWAFLPPHHLPLQGPTLQNCFPVDLLTEPLKLSPAHFACSLDCEPVEIWEWQTSCKVKL